MNRPVTIAAAAALALLTAAVLIVWPAAPPPVSHPAGAPASSAPTQPVASGAPHYEVTGDGPASIRYEIVDEDSEIPQATLPWVKSTGAEWMSVEAQRLAPGDGVITCTITGHGRVVATQTARGPYVSCRASGNPEKPPPPAAPRKPVEVCATCIKPGWWS